MRGMLQWLRRTVRRNPAGALLEVVSLLFITMVIYLNLNLTNDVIVALKQDADTATYGFDVTVSAYDGAPFGVEVFPVMTQDGALPILSQTYESGDVIGINYYMTFRTDVETLIGRELGHLTQGSLPQKNDEALILSYKAELLGMTVGDTVTIADDDGAAQTFRVCGIVDSVALLDNVRPDIIELILPQSETVTAQTVLLDCRTLGVDAAQLRETYPYLNFETNESDDAAEQTDSVRQVLLLLCGIMAVIAVALISALTGNRLQERLHDYAAFRCVGATNRAWSALLYLENLIYALPASVLGIALGELVRIGIISAYYDGDASGREFNLLFVCISVLSTMLFVTAVTAVARLRAGRTTLREALLSTPSCAYKLSRSHVIIGAGLLLGGTVLYLCNRRYAAILNEMVLLCLIVGAMLFIPCLARAFSNLTAKLIRRRGQGPFYLAVRRLTVSKSNIGGLRLMAAMVALCSAFLFAVVSINAYFNEYAKKFGYDAAIRGTDLSDDACAFILQQEGVESIYKEYTSNVWITDARGDAVEVKVAKMNGWFYGVTFLDDAADNLAPGECICDKIFAAQHGYTRGSVIEMPCADGQTLSLTVTGFCDATIFQSDRQFIVVCDEDYFTYLTTEPKRICVTLAEGYDKQDALASLRMLSYLKVDGSVSVILNSYHFDAELSKTVTALKLFSVLPVLVVILAVAGLINNQLLSFKRRRREYAVMYAVAMSRRQIYAAALYETVLICGLGALLGCGLGLYMTVVLRDVLFTMISWLPLQIPVVTYLLALAALCVLVTVLSMLPYRSMVKISVTEEIRKDA